MLFLALVMLSFNAFSRTQPQGDGTENNPYLISTKAQFEAIAQQQNGASGKYFKQIADIDLGNIGETENAIVSTEFKGIYDGGGFTITYSASFLGTTITGDYGLFSTVSGTIKNLNVNANVTLGGNATAMNVALLCGFLEQNGLIEFCNVSGNINSTVNASEGGGSDTGLIVGESKGTITYCNASGNVVGVGYAGGIVGQLTSPAVVRGCAFTGSVTALDCARQLFSTWGSFAGGICGFANSGTTIDLCYSNADIVAGKQSHGAVSTNTAKWWEVSTGIGLSSGTPTVTNNYSAGTVNGNDIDSSDDITNSHGTVSGNYYEGQVSADSIANALNNAAAAAGDTNIHFSVVNGEVVFGRVEMICETPINLVVENNGSEFTITWEIGTDATINETTWHWTLTGGNPLYRNAEGQREGTTTTPSVEFDTVLSSGEPYIFTVYTDCSTVQEGLLSNSASARFYMFGLGVANCNAVENLNVTNKGVTNATVNWKGTNLPATPVYQLKINGEEPIIVQGVQGVQECFNTFENLEPATTYTVEVRGTCGDFNLEQRATINWGNPATITFTTLSLYETAKSGEFNKSETWVGGRVPSGSVGNIKINEGHIVTLAHTLTLENGCQIINDGVLKITTQGGELINTTSTNVGGIVEVETPNKIQNKWTFIGAPFETGYKLECIKPAGNDVSISKYDYEEGNWSDEWARISTEMEAAEGYFTWPFYSGVITYTTYGDVCEKNADGEWEEKPYNYDKQPATALNNVDVIITKNVQGNTSTGRWMALSNPYPAKLSVSKFVATNTNIASTEGNIQGQGIYRLTNNVSDGVQTYTFVTTGDIAMTEGFFVNLASGSSSVTFSKTQLTNYPTTQAKSQVAPREFVELSLVKGNHKSKLYFAHNQEAEQNYDIFDANKLFALGEVAEPYFVTDGTALVKEEVKELPYYATMNVRSFANDTISFVVENIPEGISVILIDNEEEIKISENIAYTTLISEGENVDRFQVLFKKASIIEEAKDSDITITNSNRLVNVASEQTDLRIEVYNALGQRVFATNDYNFTLNQVSAGTYMIKAFNNKASKTQKIVVE